MYIKVNRKTAEMLVTEGYRVRVLPCKVRLKNLWFQPAEIDAIKLLEWDTTFTKFVNEYTYYNCGVELGNYPSFYLYGDFTMGGAWDKCYGYEEALAMYQLLKQEAKAFADNW